MPIILGREYENSAFGALRFQTDLMNPFDLDLRWTAARMGYGSVVAFGGYGVAALVTGTPMPSMAVQSVNRAFMTASRWRNYASLGIRAAPHLPFIAAAHSQVKPFATGEMEHTLPGMVLNPVMEKWLHGLGRSDPRGGSESGLFYRP